MEIPEKQPVFYVLFIETAYDSFDDAVANASDVLALHRERSNEWHTSGKLLMAGAFLDGQGEKLSTMAILSTREDAEEYAKGDPFVVNGMVNEWHIRKWANLFA